MCENLIAREDNTPVIGYKIVVKDGKRYKSSAMGFLYRKDGRIPIPKKQRSLAKQMWSNNILTVGSGNNNPQQIGRTAVFVHLKDVINEFLYPFWHGYPKNHIVVKVVLKNSLMDGVYADKHVVCGKHMEIIEEIQCPK